MVLYISHHRGESTRFNSYERALHLASANYITYIFECAPVQPSKVIPQATNTSSSSSNEPKDLSAFITRTLCDAQLPTSALLTALVYLSRLKARYPLSRGGSGPRLFLAALILGQKYLLDAPYSAKTWCKVVNGAFRLDEVRIMEKELLEFLSWDLFVIDAQLRRIEDWVATHYGDRCNTTACLRPLPRSRSSAFVDTPLHPRAPYPPLPSSASMISLSRSDSLTSAFEDADRPVAPYSAKRPAPPQYSRSRSPVLELVHANHRQRHRMRSPATSYRPVSVGSNRPAPDIVSPASVAPPILACVPEASSTSLKKSSSRPIPVRRPSAPLVTRSNSSTSICTLACVRPSVRSLASLNASRCPSLDSEDTDDPRANDRETSPPLLSSEFSQDLKPLIQADEKGDSGLMRQTHALFKLARGR